LKNRLSLFLTYIICGLSPNLVRAQTRALNTTGQFWGETDLAGRISKKLKWQFDAQYSRQSAYEDANLFRYNSQLTIRPWLHYYPIKNLRVSAFFGLWYNFAIDEVGAREYPELRAAVQLNYYTVIHRNVILNRIRPELREIRDRQGIFETAGRIRYMFKYQRLLVHDQYDKNSVYLIVFDEVFANLGSKVTGNRFFDQNRVFVGVGYNVTNDIAIETGYFNQFQQHAHDVHFDMNHVWQLSLIIDNLNPKVRKQPKQTTPPARKAQIEH
jgi:hypothetical protein